MSLRRICDVIVWRNVRLQGAVAGRFFATESKDEVVDIITADEEPIYTSDPQFQEELAKKRNKSQLTSYHRNTLMDVRPYDQSIEWFHNTVRYKRRMLGRYGLKGNDEPAGFAWPTPEEVKDAQEYERVAFPVSLQERWKKLEEEKRIKAEQVQAKEAEITEKLAKMGQWIAELNTKVAKKEAALEAAKLRKKRLMEDVRKHFGFKISPHDERFQTLVAQKEKEEKKMKKQAKKKAQMDKFTGMAEKMSKNASEEQETDSKKSVE